MTRRTRSRSTRRPRRPPADRVPHRGTHDDLLPAESRAAPNPCADDYPWSDFTAAFLAWKQQTSRHPEDFARTLSLCEQFRPVRYLREIDPQYVIAFRQWRLQHGVTPRTVNKQVGHLCHLLNTAVDWRCLRVNPVAGLRALRHDKPAKQRRALSLAEVQALFDHSPPYLRDVWQMLMTTGIRKHELATLEFTDVDFVRGTVTIRAAAAKSHKAREIPLSDDTLRMIVRLRDAAAHRRPVDHPDPRLAAKQRAAFSRTHIFVTGAHTPWRNNLLARFYACCQRAGIAGAAPGGSVDLHSLRVSFVTLALEHGATPRAVQEIVGHATLNLTMNVYARVTDQSKRHAIRALPFARTAAPDTLGEATVVGNAAVAAAGTLDAPRSEPAGECAASAKESPLRRLPRRPLKQRTFRFVCNLA